MEILLVLALLCWFCAFILMAVSTHKLKMDNPPGETVKLDMQNMKKHKAMFTPLGYNLFRLAWVLFAVGSILNVIYWLR